MKKELSLDNYDVEILINTKEKSSNAKKIYYIKIDNIENIEKILNEEKINPNDLKSKTLVSLSSIDSKDLVLSIYSFIIGYAGRRVDFSFDGYITKIDKLHNFARKKIDAGKIELQNEEVIIGDKKNSEEININFKSEITPDLVSTLRYAKKLIIKESSISVQQELLQFVIISSLRIKDKAENLPSFCNIIGDCIDLDEYRKKGSEYKKRLRSVIEIELIERTDLSERQVEIEKYDQIDIAKVISFLGSKKNEDLDLWHCTRPYNHRNKDANPSMTIIDNKTRCFRCDTEEIGPIRVILETLNISPDDAVNVIKNI
jgi:hypothetical protein